MYNKYITNKRFKKKCISGEVNIPYGKKCEVIGNTIYFKNQPVCFTTSQDAYDYFSCDDDGEGLKRGKLVHQIKDTLSKRDDDYQKRWDKIWADLGLHKFRRMEHEDFWVWNFNFYNAPIKDLEYILKKIQGV